MLSPEKVKRNPCHGVVAGSLAVPPSGGGATRSGG